jgi:tetratricopeptide (TPR) repeat protein
MRTALASVVSPASPSSSYSSSRIADRRRVASRSRSQRQDDYEEVGSLKLDTFRVSRRTASLGAGALAFLAGIRASSSSSAVAATVDKVTVDEFNALEREAKAAYMRRDLDVAVQRLTTIIDLEPTEPVWLERRAQVLVDLKRFKEAIADYDAAEGMYSSEYRSLGMLSNRALAYEGLADWKNAVKDYSEAIKYSEMIGAVPPYVLNSRGNCYNSLGEYEKALDDYLRAATIFQSSRNLSGAIYASSNAALMKAELGRIDEAIEDMERVARRAAGSVDMRAALSALYYSRGEQQRAEDAWNWSCTQINSGQLVEGGPVLDGCELYRDYDWLLRIRRWPPSMVDKFRKFIELS